jgi:hypothetical protein
MADSAGGAEQLLLAFGIDLSPVKEAVKGISAMLGSLNDMADQLDAKSKSTTTGATAQSKELAVQASAAVAAAKQAILEENKKAAAAKATAAELKVQTVEHQAHAAAAKSDVASQQAKLSELRSQSQELKNQQQELRNQTAEINKQVSELRRKRLEAQQERKAEGGGGGGGGGLIEKVTSGIFGKGLAGSVAGGVLAGEGIVAVIEGAGTAIEHFIDKLKEVSVESGNIVALQKVFDGLAKGAGLDATETMSRLGEASEGLVSKLTLLKVATTALRSPYKLNMDAVTQLTHDVTTLAEASGRTAEQGISALTRSLERGRPMMLGMVTGVAGLRDIMRDIPPALSPVQRSMLQWQRAMKMLHDQALAIGELPDTFEKFSTRMHVASQNAMLAFGQAFNQSEGIQSFFKQMGGVNRLFKDMEGLATAAGNALGRAFQFAGSTIEFVYEHLDALKTVLELVASAIVTNYILSLGAAFGELVPKIIESVKAFTSLKEVMEGTKTAAIGLGGGLVTLLTALSGFFFFKGFESWKDEISAARHETVTWSDYISALGKKIAAIADGIVKMNPSAIWAAASQSLETYVDNLIKARSEMERMRTVLQRPGEQKVYGSETEAAAGQFFKGAITPPPGMDQETIQQKRQAAQREMQDEMARNKEALDRQMAFVEERKQLDNDAYKDAEEDAKTHYQTQANLEGESLTAQLALIQKNYNAQKAAMDERLRDGIERQDSYDKELDALQAKTSDQRVQAERKYFTKIQQIRQQLSQDTMAAERKHVQDEVAAREAQIQARMDFNQKSVGGGSQSVDSYYQKQLEYINEIKAAKIDEVYQISALQKDSAVNDAQREASIRAATDDATKKVEALFDSLASLRFQSIEKRFQPMQQLLGTQIQFGQQQAAGGNVGAEPQEQIQQMLAQIQNYRNELTSAANQMINDSLNRGVALNLDTWTQILDKIEQSYETQQKWTTELEKMQNLLSPVEGMFQSIGQTMAKIWSNHTGNIGSTIAGAAGSMGTIQSDIQKAFGSFGVKSKSWGQVQKDPATLALEQEAKDLFNNAGNASTLLQGNFDKLSQIVGILTGDMSTLHASMTGQATPTAPAATESGQGSGTGQPISTNTNAPGGQAQGTTGASGAAGGGSAIDKWTTGIASATAAIGSFVEAISKAQSAIAGAFGGGLGGASAGQSLGQGLGSLIPSLGDMGGPIGMIAGAGLGAVIGGITGQKNEQMQHNIEELNQSYREIMQQFSQNTNNLQQAIYAMENLIAQAEEMQANSKKGGQQYAQLIQQYQQELNQLQNQQYQIITSMQTQLAILQTPLQGQSYLNSVNDIIKQYDQFLGAAQNASQLAQANQFLASSLQNLATSYSQQLLQNETQAVQDALQLNELYQQRLLYVNQLNNQIQSILQQGSLTRQQTMAQKKGQQIEQLQAQANVQLDQMNQEIAVQQMKVSAESQVFQLATTRIGLEMQLLSLQGAQTSYQMAQISAMQALVDTLSAGNYNFTTLQALLNALGFTTAAGTAPINTTGYSGGGGLPPGYSLPPGNLPPVNSGITVGSASADSLTNLFAQAYADRASIGYGNYRGAQL